MRESSIKLATEMIERRNKLIRQIEQLQDHSRLVTGGSKISAQLHFNSGTIHIGVTQEIFDLIVTDMKDQAEYINNQLKGMGITTLDEEMEAAVETLAKRTSVPVTREPRSFKPVPTDPMIPSVFVDQESKFAPKMLGQSGITTGKDPDLNSRVSDPDLEPPRHPDDDFGDGGESVDKAVERIMTDPFWNNGD